MCASRVAMPTVRRPATALLAGLPAELRVDRGLLLAAAREVEFNLLDDDFKPLLTVGSGPDRPWRILLSPQGRLFTQPVAHELAARPAVAG